MALEKFTKVLNTHPHIQYLFFLIYLCNFVSGAILRIHLHRVTIFYLFSSESGKSIFFGGVRLRFVKRNYIPHRSLRNDSYSIVLEVHLCNIGTGRCVNREKLLILTRLLDCTVYMV